MCTSREQLRKISCAMKYAHYLNSTWLGSEENDVVAYRKHSQSIHEVGSRFAHTRLLGQSAAGPCDSIKQAVRKIDALFRDIHPDVVQIAFRLRRKASISHTLLRRGGEILSGCRFKLGCVKQAQIATVRLLNSNLKLASKAFKLTGSLAHLSECVLYDSFPRGIRSRRHQTVDKGCKVVRNGNIHGELARK